MKYQVFMAYFLLTFHLCHANRKTAIKMPYIPKRRNWRKELLNFRNSAQNSQNLQLKNATSNSFVEESPFESSVSLKFTHPYLTLNSSFSNLTNSLRNQSKDVLENEYFSHINNTVDHYDYHIKVSNDVHKKSNENQKSLKNISTPSNFYEAPEIEENLPKYPEHLREYEYKNGATNFYEKTMKLENVNPLKFLIDNPDYVLDVKISSKRRRHAKRRHKKRRNDKRKALKAKRRKKNKKDSHIHEILTENDINYENINNSDFFECCPSKAIVTIKLIGKDRNNRAVRIHTDYRHFYERICLEEITNKPCLFPKKSIKKKYPSMCVQQYIHTKAMVKPYESKSSWTLDYIQIRSGCSCHMALPPKKKNSNNKNRFA